MGAIQSAMNSMIGSVAAVTIAAKKFGASKQEEAAKRAKKSSQDEVTQKQKQRRNFAEYLAKQPTSLGGTVGDLPKTAQKQIAAQYTKSQRKSLMDKMDREASNGKH